MTTIAHRSSGASAQSGGTDRELAERVKRAGLRPTRQRISLARLLFDGQEKHVTAEQLHKEAKDADLPVSLATVYNTLNQFTDVGLLREVVVEPGRSYFDTNIHDHHHFYYQDDGSLQDIPGEQVRLAELPDAPEGTSVDRVDVIVRVRRDN